MRVVICGGGVIGASTAYFLSRRGAEVVVVERREVACAASGRSGAFLARDWSAGTLLDAMARRSFDLHALLPDEIGGHWGFHRLDTYGGFAVGVQDARRHRPADVEWLADGVIIGGSLGSPLTTAVIHPAAFTTAMMRAAQGLGAELRRGAVTGVVRRVGGAIVEGVEVDGEFLRGDAVVIAMGPWSLLAAAWLPLPGVFADKGHSIVFDTGTAGPTDALFLEYQEPSGVLLEPEVFPRADGTTYVTAGSSRGALPLDPAHVAPDPGGIERLQEVCGRLSPVLAEARVIARHASYRPVTLDNLPLIGRVPGVAGGYVATGHGGWGMLNAPATGEAVAELIIDGVAHSTDLTPFDPDRLRPLDPALLRTGRAP
jgi:glycine/D-amino acid oxidase-like deaminating enzyme